MLNTEEEFLRQIGAAITLGPSERLGIGSLRPVDACLRRQDNSCFALSFPRRRESMDSDCPFWPGNKVGDTHLLVLIPEQVSDKPLTLDYLGELIKSTQGDGHKTQYRGDGYAKYVRPAIGNQVSGSSYWVLMTRDVLPGSRWKSYADQCVLVSDHANRMGLPYEVPGALEAAVVMLLHHVRSGERLYSDNPFTYTRCRESVVVDDNDYAVVVGGLSSGGLSVFDGNYDYNDGVAGLRKF